MRPGKFDFKIVQSLILSNTSQSEIWEPTTRTIVSRDNQTGEWCSVNGEWTTSLRLDKDEEWNWGELKKVRSLYDIEPPQWNLRTHPMSHRKMLLILVPMME